MDNPAEIKNPNLGLTCVFFLIAVLSFLGITTAHVTDENGFNSFGQVLLITANIGFWGLTYRASTHFRYLLKNKPGAGVIRIVLTSFFVVGFIFLFATVVSKVRNPMPTTVLEPDPYADLKKQMKEQKNKLEPSDLEGK